MKHLLLITILLFTAEFASAQSKMAHLNSQDVMTAMPTYQSAIQKLENFQIETGKELNAMEMDYDLAVKNYMAKAESLSPVMRQIEEDKLGKKENDINIRDQNIQKEVQAYSRELNQPIVTLVEKAIKTVSDRHKYDYVFDVSVVMIHNGPDITKEVITEVLRLEKEKQTPPPVEIIKP